jgi:RimJ/RimL family protein N-acetyltransferase
MLATAYRFLNIVEVPMAKNTFTLFGHYIDLELLDDQHIQGLSQVVSHEKLWQHEQTFIPTPELIPIYITRSLRGNDKGIEIPFAIMDKQTHKVVGSIKLQNIHHDSAEIGSTFIDTQHQKTAVNSEAKLMLLQHAFEALRLHHIDFIVHKDNHASQTSLEHLGIRTYRCFSHLKTMPEWENDEYLSYIITAKEWESVKENLEFKLFS